MPQGNKQARVTRYIIRTRIHMWAPQRLPIRAVRIRRESENERIALTPSPCVSRDAGKRTWFTRAHISVPARLRAFHLSLFTLYPTLRL